MDERKLKMLTKLRLFWLFNNNPAKNHTPHTLRRKNRKGAVETAPFLFLQSGKRYSARPLKILDVSAGTTTPWNVALCPLKVGFTLAIAVLLPAKTVISMRPVKIAP